MASRKRRRVRPGAAVRAAVALGFAAAAAAVAAAADPFAWLEQVHGSRALAWVARQNARTAATLDADPRYETFRREALGIFEARDRIPRVRFRGDAVDDVWQDTAQPHGLWRTVGLGAFRAGAAPSDVLLDLDRLSREEGHGWFLKGAECRPPAGTDCLLLLSEGGGDAVSVREFDATTRRFVTGPEGFALGPGKQSVAWLDADRLVAARDWSGHGRDLAASGYPLEIRRLARGGAGTTLFRGAPTDAYVEPAVLRDPVGRTAALLAVRHVTFFTRDFLLLDTGHAPVRLPLPRKATLAGLVDGQVVFTVDEAWHGFPAGSIVSFALASLRRDAAHAVPVAALVPGPGEAVDDVAPTAHRLVVSLLHEVRGEMRSLAFADGRWTATRLAFPADDALTIAATSPAHDHVFVTTQGFLDPTALWLADAASGGLDRVRTLPARFDARRDVVEQGFARSADGTRVPYFLVRPRTMRADGTTPVQLFGYGGFQVALTPQYRPELGKLWLERGGAYAVANIRGGGEFGPAWHEAALGAHRQRAFDDFAAVARDLVAAHVTSPSRLGIYGRSNGGVLVSVAMTEHPELFGAVVIESPLIDMLRYTHLPAGALWTAEYGDPDRPSDRAFIARYSAYANARRGVAYPEPYITTNTADDRVHPGHARKFAALLESFGDPVLYYENAFGGHSNDADPELDARRWARHYVYLARRLMDRPAKE